MVQTVLRYNVMESPDKTSFTLTAEQARNICNGCSGSNPTIVSYSASVVKPKID
jgi:hypothetical protein